MIGTKHCIPASWLNIARSDGIIDVRHKDTQVIAFIFRQCNCRARMQPQNMRCFMMTNAIVAFGDLLRKLVKAHFFPESASSRSTVNGVIVHMEC